MGLYFLRHGKSQANMDRTFAGQSDSRLIEQGVQDAEAEGRRLKDENVHFDFIISSH